MNLKSIKDRIYKLIIRFIYRVPDTLKDAVEVVPVSMGRISVDPAVASILIPYLPVHKQNRMTFREVMEGFECSVEVRNLKFVRLIESVDEWKNRFFLFRIPRLKVVAYIERFVRNWQYKNNGFLIWYIEPWYENYYHWLICHVAKMIECDQAGKISGYVGMPIDISASKVRMESLAGINCGSFEPKIVSGTWAGDLAHVARKGLPIQGIRSLREKFAINSSGLSGRRIYITRNTAHYRFIENDSEFQDFLKSRGFEFVEFDGLSFRDQANALIGADVIVGVHGAGLSNIIFAPEGARLIEICPDFLNDPSYLSLCLICGINYTRLAARTISPEAPEYSDLEVDIPAVEKILDSSPSPGDSNSKYFHVPAMAARIDIKNANQFAM